MATTIIKMISTKGFSGSQQSESAIYYATVDVPGDDGSAIAAVSALTPPAGYRLDEIQCKLRGQDPRVFEVSATYRTPDGSWADDPLDRPSILTATYDEWTEDYFRDSEGIFVLNSANDRFDQMPQRKNGSMVLQVQKNFVSFNAPAFDAIKFTTNASTITIRGTSYSPDTLLFLPPACAEQYEMINGVSHHYYAITFRLATDSNKHQHKIDDRGFYELGHKMIFDSDNMPVTAPWPLDGAGSKKEAGANPEILTFTPYASANWGISFE